MTEASQAADRLTRPHFPVLAAPVEREALRQYATACGRAGAAHHREQQVMLLAEQVWRVAERLACAALDSGSIQTDDRPQFLRLFKTAYFSGYNAYFDELRQAQRQARRRARRAGGAA